MKKIIIGLFLVGFLIVPMFSFAQVGDIDPNPDANTCVSLQSSNLRYRARDINTNGEVSTLQDFLQSQGYLNNEPTGYFGILTVKAVKDFQKANKINPTGYVGTVTKAKIQSLTCDGTIPQPSEQKFNGYLTPQGPSTRMWGTHMLALEQETTKCAVGSKCADTLRAKTYPVSGKDSVLSDLKRYENSRVIILGKLQWNDLEGGFWGIVASKVTPLTENSNEPVISGVSGPQTLNVNQAGTWAVKAYDKNGGNLSYSVNWGDNREVDCASLDCGMVRSMQVYQQSATFTHSYPKAGTYTPTFYVTNSSGQSATTSLTVKVGEAILTLDTTPRIMYWWGKVNQHVDANGNWLTDPDGTSGANLDKLTYCKKWFPNTTSVEDYKLETMTGWRNAGNTGGPFTSIKMSTKCVQGEVITTDPLVTYVYNTDVSQITSNSAVVSGRASVQYRSSSYTPIVNISTAGYFTYDSNLGFNNRTNIVPLQGYGSVPATGLNADWNTPLTNLTPNTTYCFRATFDRYDINTGKTTKNHAEPQKCFKTLASNITPVNILTVTSPNGGETFANGSTQTITWQDNIMTASMMPTYYDISLVPYYGSCAGSSPCPLMPYHAPYTIAQNVSGGSYSWPIAGNLVAIPSYISIPDGQYTIKICRTNSDLCDSSNSYFKIASNI